MGIDPRDSLAQLRNLFVFKAICAMQDLSDVVYDWGHFVPLDPMLRPRSSVEFTPQTHNFDQELTEALDSADGLICKSRDFHGTSNTQELLRKASPMTTAQLLLWARQHGIDPVNK